MHPRRQLLSQGISYAYPNASSFPLLAHLKLGLVLSLLEDRLHLRSLHHSSLDLELTAHEQLLCIGLARNELRKVLIREVECDCYRMLSGLVLFNLLEYRIY